MKKIAVLASGNGTNLQALIDAIEKGDLGAQISLVISDRSDAFAIKRAEHHGIVNRVMKRTEENSERYFDEIADEIASSGADIIVMAGFMKILPDSFVRGFENRIINIHPSLLPSFGGRGYYGMRVHEAVIKSGARITGCTVHFVSTEVDGGPIIEQRPMEVMDSDTAESLASRIHEIEHEALVFSTALILEGKYEIRGKRVMRLVN